MGKCPKASCSMVLNLVKGRQADCQTKWQFSVLARVRFYTSMGKGVSHEWVKRGRAECSVKTKVLSLVLKLLCFIGLALLKMPNLSASKSQGCSCRNIQVGWANDVLVLVRFPIRFLSFRQHPTRDARDHIQQSTHSLTLTKIMCSDAIKATP